MERLLITGSREVDIRMVWLTVGCVTRCKALGWEVVVGDADGVDEKVIAICDDLLVPVTVMGAYGRMRHRSISGKNIPWATRSYLVRDQQLAAACTRAVAIWNGTSRGTLYTGQYAEHIGKHVDWLYCKPVTGEYHKLMMPVYRYTMNLPDYAQAIA